MHSWLSMQNSTTTNVVEQNTMQATPLTVSQLNQAVKRLLENNYQQLRVCGEVSNLTVAASGHAYFTLKDSNSQIRCAFFKTQKKQIMPILKNGLQIIVSGKLSLFEPRGDYQLIVQSYEDAGLGKLNQEFELLKNKLLNEGLFASSRKKLLPKFPQHIAIITSPKGAALRDILITLYNRYPLADISLYPCEVQGISASEQIIKSLREAYQNHTVEVIILARGGGSREDLWAFNHEGLARIIAESPKPVVTGIGHETDFTIADFVADVRAATPTAAAAITTPDQRQIQQNLKNIQETLYVNMSVFLQKYQKELAFIDSKIKISIPKLQQQTQLLDFIENKLQQNLIQKIQTHEHQLLKFYHRLTKTSQISTINILLSQQKIIENQLIQNIKNKLTHHQHGFKLSMQELNTMSPLATLNRGYAIATQGNQVITQSKDINRKKPIDIQLAHEKIKVRMIYTSNNNDEL